MAEKEVKPSWWREFLQKIKMALRNLPRFGDLRFSDRELEAMLMRSARAMRKRDANRVAIPGTDIHFDLDPDTMVQVVKVPDLGIDLTDTKAVRAFLHDAFKGREVEIKSDGRLMLFSRRGLDDSLKVRGEHRKAYAALDQIVENAVYLGYDPVDGDPKHSHLRGQFIYGAAVEFNGELHTVQIKLDDSHVGNRAIYKGHTVKKIEGVPYVGSSRNGPEILPITPSFMQAKQLKELFPDIIAQDGGDVKFSIAPPTESESFKRWFGNSKVVDEDGKPLVVYHGTNEGGDTVFDTDDNGDTEGTGVFFTSNREVADGYMQHGAPGSARAAYAAYLKMANPFIFDFAGRDWNKAEPSGWMLQDSSGNELHPAWFLICFECKRSHAPLQILLHR